MRNGLLFVLTLTALSVPISEAQTGGPLPPRFFIEQDESHNRVKDVTPELRATLVQVSLTARAAVTAEAAIDASAFEKTDADEFRRRVSETRNIFETVDGQIKRILARGNFDSADLVLVYLNIDEIGFNCASMDVLSKLQIFLHDHSQFDNFVRVIKAEGQLDEASKSLVQAVLGTIKGDEITISRCRQGKQIR